MNIHLPAILMFTRGTRFWHTAILLFLHQNHLIWKTCQRTWWHPVQLIVMKNRLEGSSIPPHLPHKTTSSHAVPRTRNCPACSAWLWASWRPTTLPCYWCGRPQQYCRPRSLRKNVAWPSLQAEVKTWGVFDLEERREATPLTWGFCFSSGLRIQNRSIHFWFPLNEIRKNTISNSHNSRPTKKWL